MIEKVVSRKNMRRAYQQVLRNEGSAGEDGMSVQELSKHHLLHVSIEAEAEKRRAIAIMQ